MAGALALLCGLLMSSPALGAYQYRLGSRILRIGMSGTDVKALQRDLTKIGFRTPADGAFGPMTERSVLAFERRFRLRPNGIADAGFLRRLTAVMAAAAAAHKRNGGNAPAPVTINAPAAPVPVSAAKATGLTLGQRTLQEGMSGTDVSQLQTDLTTAGFATAVDGSFGPATKTAVLAFEQANNLTADGIVDAADVAALQKLDAAAVGGGPVAQATLNADGTATAPAGAPADVQQMIAAANQIIHTPYLYGGGHQSFTSPGYDCSGAVSYALHGAGLLSTPEDSTDLETFGLAGAGRWVSVYGDAAHAFIVIAGLAFDTAHYGPINPSGTGPRWLQPAYALANLSDGGNYAVRHPASL